MTRATIAFFANRALTRVRSTQPTFVATLGSGKRQLSQQPPPSIPNCNKTLPLAEALKNTNSLEEAYSTLTQHGFQQIRPMLVKFVEQHPNLFSKWSILFSLAIVYLGPTLYFSFPERPQTINNIEEDKFRPLNEAVTRKEEATLTEVIEKDKAPIKFISISGAPGIGKSTLVSQTLSKITSRNGLFSLVDKPFSLIWYLDASSEDTLWKNTRELAQALHIDLAQIIDPNRTDEWNFQTLVDQIKRALTNQKRWIIAFDNIDSMKLLRQTNWYTSSPNAGFPQKPDHDHGRIIFIHREQQPKLNATDLRQGNIISLNLNRGLDHDETKSLIKKICADRVDKHFITDINRQIFQLPISISYPLVKCRI